MRLATRLILLLLIVPNALQAELRLTELDLSTGQVELTNIGSTVHEATSLDWCIPFAYGSMESGGFSFQPGESRVYTISSTFFDADDLWFYQDRVDPGFGDETKVVTGIVWGSSQAGQGRVDAVVNETSGVWASNTDFVSTAGLLPGQTLQAIYPGTNIDQSIGWTIGDANLGVFVPEPSGLALLLMGLVAFRCQRRERKSRRPLKY